MTSEVWGFQHMCECRHVNCLCKTPVLCTHGTGVECVCTMCEEGRHDYYDASAEREFLRPINPDPVTAMAKAAKG